jgi:hypothetical protein
MNCGFSGVGLTVLEDVEVFFALTELVLTVVFRADGDTAVFLADDPAFFDDFTVFLHEADFVAFFIIFYLLLL